MKIVTLFCSLICLFTLIGTAQAEELPLGKVIPKLTCQADAQQSYALYLPSNYSPQRRWPILYAFDPGARGSVPVERFQAAAERYGYIVVGSNNSRNGPIEPVNAAVNAVYKDTHSRFAIDDQRIYTAGFSGGARVAAQVAFACHCVTGVIGCGAGIPVNIKPSADTPFQFFGTIGFDDFNYPELRQLSESFDSLGVTNRIVTFVGGHEWASPALCQEAIEWFELQAIKNNKRAKDDKLIDQLLQTRTDQAKQLAASGQAFAAYQAYRSLARDFHNLREVAEFEKQAESLKNSKEVKDFLNKEAEQVQLQKEQIGHINSLLATSKSPTDHFDAISELRTLLADLLRKAHDQQDSEQRRLARRVFNGTMVMLYEEVNMNLLTKKYAQAITGLELQARLLPDNPNVHFNLACGYAQSGDKKKALEALKKAIEKGFNNLALLEQEPDLASIRNEPNFQKLVDQLKKNGAAPITDR